MVLASEVIMMAWMRACRMVVFLCLMAGGGCGGQTTSVTIDSGGPETQTILDTATESTQPDAVVFADTVAPETKADYVFKDYGFADLPDDADVGHQLACEVGEGCFLDECTENQECQSGWCVEHMGQKVCTQNCQEECPAGWTCSQVGASGPDVVFICVSNFANLCRPCSEPVDCQGVTGTEDACVVYGAAGAFCGGACDDALGVGKKCPWGFACLAVTTVDGIELDQCVADTGLCPCTDTAVELGLFTNCQLSNEFGTCQGKRVCTEAGLTDCDAPEPAEETCNGVDDDCNGDVDEGDIVEGIGVCDDGNDCTDDNCLGPDGCENTALSEGECLDDDPCTVADHCDEGVCVGNPVMCDDDNPCTDDECDGAGGCVFVDNTSECDDGNPCTVADKCSDGECSGVEVSCDCQVDEDCLEYEDGNLCNGTLFCNLEEWPYKCSIVPETVVQCDEPEAGPDAICLKSSCDPGTGECALVADHEGFACEDGNACTIGDKCVAGACTPGVPDVCADNNPCTDDICDAEIGCVFTDNNLPCQDGNICTTSDTCAGGECQPGAPLVCQDSNDCTDDACDPALGCVHLANNAGCDDGVECTVGDHCADGECVYENLDSCDDENPCTDNYCNPAQGCVTTLNQAPCNDEDVCTSGDHCHLGECVFLEELVCDDYNECTDDSCDPLQGCVFTINEAPCDDLNACTAGENCFAGVCAGGQPLDCDDGDSCTTHSCSPVFGCQYQNVCVGTVAVAVVPAAFTRYELEEGTMTLTMGQPDAGWQESAATSAHFGICPISIAE